ncbi:MAG: hypothetical protein H6732_17920 [Alphaproteobacteria bacterium]|nr:hypothetical protein [Alphaproteobacteria bacterium]
MVIPLLLASALGLAAEDAPPVAPPREVELLSAGRGRKHLLRISPQADDTWDVQLRRRASTSTSLDQGPRQQTPLPAQVHELTAHVDPGGLELRLLAAEQPGAPMELHLDLRDAVQALAAIPWVSAPDPRQRTVPVVQSVPDDPDALQAELVADVAWSLDLVSVPLPEERVGRGARWRVQRPATEQGIAVTQEATYEVLRVKGTEVVLGLSLTLHTAPDALLDEARVEGFEATGEGTLWLDLRRPLARAADLSLDGSIVVTWIDEDVPHRVDGTFHTRLQLATR